MLILRVSDLSLRTPTGETLCEKLNCELHDRQLLLVSGPNGAGKSTLLRALMNGYPYQGRIEWFVDMKRIQYISQLENTEVHWPLTLKDVLTISLPRRTRWEAIRMYGSELIENDMLLRPWNTSSGGERKKVLYVRALVHKPTVLIGDEPMNHLDTESRIKLAESLMQYLATSENHAPRAAILVSHIALLGKIPSNLQTVQLELGKKNG